MQLVRPAIEHLPSYVAALRSGWSADNLRGAVASGEELQRIEQDAARFVAGLYDVEGRGPPITLPDGSQVPRLPGYRLWMWDGDFCGWIGLRWQPGSSELPPYVLGHIGYGVVPWKRRRGYATRALCLLLPEAKTAGLGFVYINTTADNIASQRVIRANGGVLVGTIREPEAYGGHEALRFRIDL